MDKKKRAFLFYLIVSPFAIQLEGCCLFIRRPRPICPKDPSIDDPKAPLTIDVHSHIFNASDLQVSRFISLVAGRRAPEWREFIDVFGEILEAVSWTSAPSGKKELKVLEKFGSDLAECKQTEWSAKIDEIGDMQYKAAVGELRAVINNRMPAAVDKVAKGTMQAPLMATDKAIATILQLPDNYKDYKELLRNKELLRKEQKGKVGIEKVSFSSAIDFIIEHFQYRYVSAYNYLQTFDRDSRRRIDLMIVHMVDYDWWLNDGIQPPTSIEDQIVTMERISILTGGRVHAFVPFCPYHQVMHEKSRGKGRSPLELVQLAIQEKGALGVKLYPPMGFAPMGNEQIEAQNPNFWDKQWLHGIARDPGFGKLLDGALRKLYAWCSDPKNDVPIMAHSNLSNGPDPDFDGLNSWTHWKDALKEYPDLRVAFGHFGDPSGNNGDAQSRGLMGLIGKNRAQGQNVFADASYFTDVLENPDRLVKELVDLYVLDAKSGSGVLPSKLMYGTDWKMVLIEEGNGQYLSDFEKILPRVEEEAKKEGLVLAGLPANFFGRNAMDFLGLKTGRSRERIDAFYKKYLPKDFVPSWMAKS